MIIKITIYPQKTEQKIFIKKCKNLGETRDLVKKYLILYGKNNVIFKVL